MLSKQERDDFFEDTPVRCPRKAMDVHGTILFHRPKETPATAFGTHHRQWQSIPIELSVEEATVTDSPRPSELFTKTWINRLLFS